MKGKTSFSDWVAAARSFAILRVLGSRGSDSVRAVSLFLSVSVLQWFAKKSSRAVDIRDV